MWSDIGGGIYRKFLKIFSNDIKLSLFNIVKKRSACLSTKGHAEAST